MKNTTNPTRAFSLIEVMVALSLGAIVMAVAFDVFVTAKFTAREASTRAQMARDAQLTLDYLGHDLNSLGVGVPAGTCGDASCTLSSSLRPALRVGRATNIVFAGDAPFPNAELPGVEVITRFAGDVDSANVAVSSEVSGGCTPYTSTSSSAFHCDSATHTLLLAPSGAFATDTCLSGAEGKRTCPWALNKWQAPSGFLSLIAIAPDSTFYTRRWDGSTFVNVDNYRGVTLSAASAGPAALTRNTFFKGSGGGVLVNLDRVFYALENASGGGECSTSNCVLKRRQCWGLITDPSAAGFPTAGAGFTGTAATLTSCTAPNDGTGWETILENIESLSFSYFNGSATLSAPLSVSDLALVRAVDVNMVIKVDTPGSGPFLRHRVSQRFFLPNRDAL